MAKYLAMSTWFSPTDNQTENDDNPTENYDNPTENYDNPTENEDNPTLKTERSSVECSPRAAGRSSKRPKWSKRYDQVPYYKPKKFSECL